ncbi:EAL domain-containing protein [Cochlodiniinecator piscidefendens]|uniref:EAL domain-containing protein n=1 Tax=Cochlodiniinecator piscidefendens TaxID=2715756 RepID=UPI001E2D94EC|nr:EAL domain-containing protein [Cochlodiniinecator piscidefendens]
MQSPLGSAIESRDRDTMKMVKEALARKSVKLAFQPIVLAGDQTRVAFYEGLIRVLDETGRIIPAREFIGAVENNELGRIIDCLALEQGLQILSEDPNLRLSINMSARSIGYPRWMETLNFGTSGKPGVAERLILEITEGSAMQMPELVTGFMNNLQERGIAFALDDFGSGYTAFRYLKDFYFDALKIDGVFIRDIAKNPDNQVLTRALVSIAQHFDMFTVAENVETAEDAAFLASIGVDCLQGYYFSAPTMMKPSDAQNLAAEYAGQAG